MKLSHYEALKIKGKEREYRADNRTSAPTYP